MSILSYEHAHSQPRRHIVLVDVVLQRHRVSITDGGQGPMVRATNVWLRVAVAAECEDASASVELRYTSYAMQFLEIHTTGKQAHFLLISYSRE
eukprot:SAG31_NODE_1357_length_8647_cov_8.257838_9_plen_94_part_00